MSQSTFSFSFDNWPSIEAHVLRFSGQAALNTLYSFKITLLVPVSLFNDVDWNDLTASRGTLRIDDGAGRGGAGPWPTGRAPSRRVAWHGLIDRLEIGAQVGEHVFLEASLGPTLGQLAGQIQNRIHLDVDTLAVLQASFQFGGLDAAQFKIKPQNYPKREFVFQYDEDLLTFVWRALEREGLVLSFDQTTDIDVAVVTDSVEQLPSLYDGDEELRFRAVGVAGLTPAEGEPQIFRFRAETSVPPAFVLLRDYNWTDPNRPLEVFLSVSPRGRGEVHLYGENFSTVAEGRRLAEIRKEEFLAAAEVCRGESALPGLMPGVVAAVFDHPLKTLNGRFLVTAAEYVGSQTGALSARLGLDLGSEGVNYLCRFSCLRLSTPYRPKRRTERAKIAGSLTAWIDGAGAGDQPEMDAYGRYKVLLPLDVSGRGSGKASAWLRMAQPYVGKGYGQNFPLTPGSEVLLTFIDGNPDRPVITGAVPNAETGSLINSGSSRLSGLGTKGGSGLMFDEDPGNQKVVLGSGSNRGSISLTTNSPTTALIQADVVNSMTMVNASMSALDTTFTTGADFVVKAENSDLTHIMSIIQGLQTAAQATSSVANTISAFDGNEEVSDADLTAKWASLMNFTAYTLFKASTLYSNIKKLLADPLPMLPHKPMLALEVNNNGASGAWRSQRTTNVDIVAWVSLLSNFVKLAKPIDDAVQNIAEDIDSNPNDSPDIKKLNKDKTELQKKVAALGDSDTDKIKKEIIQSKIDDINSQILKLNEQLEKNKNKLSKKLSLASNVGSETVDVIFNIISLVTSIWAMKKPYKSLEGILINNLDSYVSIQANNHISMSGYGPTIIESSKALLGDLLRFGLYETNLPTKLIIPESSVTLASFGTASFKKSKAILLRSDIIRSRANEISLQATDAIFSQATNQIQLITGIKPANITRKTAITAAEQAYNTSYNLAEAAEDNSPDKAEKIQATYPFAHTLLNLDHPTVAESTFTKGIYLKTEEASMPILIATANSDSKITLAQSVADIATNENDRYLELNKDFVHLQNCKNSLLHLSDKNAELKADENSYLKIGSQTINLSSTNKTNLTMNATDATLKGETGVVLTANNGQNSLTINSQGIALKVGGSSVKLTPAVAQMMS